MDEHSFHVPPVSVMKFMEVMKFMVLGTIEDDSFVLNIGKNKIESSSEVTLQRVKIGKQLKFKSHVEELCRKAA